MKIIILSFMTLGLMACGLMERHPGSGYLDLDENPATPPPSLQQVELQNTKEELGYQTKVLNEMEQQRLLLRLKLNQLEKELITKKEREQYYKLKPYFKNDSQRIKFLSIPTLEQRAQYAGVYGISAENTDYGPRSIAAIENKDIIVGMTREAVVESWGEPDAKEIAGNSIYGNERWVYQKYISGSNGYTKENRTIYFESGQVAGWSRE